MPDTGNQSYWLDCSLQSFIKNVWQTGLYKFSLDTENESACLVFGQFEIEVSPDVVASSVIINLSNQTTNLKISISLIDVDEPVYQLIVCKDFEKATDMIDEIIDCWAAGFFVLKV